MYLASPDPVVRTNARRQGIGVLGGSGTSADTTEVERFALDTRPGDEAITEAIERELHEYAAAHQPDTYVIYIDICS